MSRGVVVCPARPEENGLVLCDLVLGGGNDRLGAEIELLLEVLQRCAGAEIMEARRQVVEHLLGGLAGPGHRLVQPREMQVDAVIEHELVDSEADALGPFQIEGAW